MRTTLKELAASGDLASRGAAARIKAGYADSTPLKDHCRSDVPARAARYPTDEPARGERRAARDGRGRERSWRPSAYAEQNDAKP
jgi:hypothetical protein